MARASEGVKGYKILNGGVTYAKFSQKISAMMMLKLKKFGAHAAPLVTSRWGCANLLTHYLEQGQEIYLYVFKFHIMFPALCKKTFDYDCKHIEFLWVK